jgi:two-component system nitrogen regulation response regulator NtrX
LVEHARILVVDDEESIRLTMTAILEEEGYSVDTAASGKEAINKSNSNFYNVALIDFRLPDMPGTELLTAFKETVPKMVKIMVTGYPSLHNAVDSVNRKADAFLMKPISVETLLNTINKLLKIQREETRYSQQKVGEFMETRIRELGEVH